MHIHHFPARPRVLFVFTPGAVFSFWAGEVPEEPRVPPRLFSRITLWEEFSRGSSRCLGSCPSPRHPPVLLDRAFNVILQPVDGG